MSFRIEDLFVGKNTRGKGIGAKLVSQTESLVIENGCQFSMKNKDIN